MFWTAFILGLAGSLHCAGMCSPLAYAVTSMSKPATINRVTYNIGRILVYGILGLIVSTIGYILPIEKFQNTLSITMGIILILVGILGASKFQAKSITRITQRFTNYLKGSFSNQLKSKSLFSYFVLGSLNGFLPCGLTLIALTATIITPTPLDGFYFMILFGLGTFPVMVGFAQLVQMISKQLNFSFSKVNMVMLILAGSLLIGRAFWHPTHPTDISNTENIEVCE